MFLRASRKYNNEVYMQDPIGVDKEGNNITIEDKLADEAYSIDEQVSLRLQSRVLREAIVRILRARERLIVELRYGLKTGEEVTQREIAKLLGISRSYVSRRAYCKRRADGRGAYADEIKEGKSASYATMLQRKQGRFGSTFAGVIYCICERESEFRRIGGMRHVCRDRQSGGLQSRPIHPTIEGR